MESLRRQNNRGVRAQNQKRILRLVRDFEPVSLEQLMKESSLSYPTVYRIIKDLELDLYVEQSDFAPTTGGRQAALYAISGVARFVLGIHIAMDELSLVITNARNGKIFQTKGVIDLDSLSLEELNKLLIEYIQTSLSTTAIEVSSLVRLCLTRPDYLNLNLEASALFLQKQLNVITETTYDSIVLNYLEGQSYHISSLSHYLYLLFDRELYLRVYRGNGGVADSATPSHIAHIIVHPEGPMCECGIRGCLQSYLGGIGLKEEYLKRGGDPEQLNNGQLFHNLMHKSYHGDRAAQRTIESIIETLAIALANVIKIQGIEVIIITNFFKNTDIALKSLLERKIASHLGPFAGGKPRVILGTTTLEDSAYAACLMMYEEYFSTLSFI